MIICRGGQKSLGAQMKTTAKSRGEALMKQLTLSNSPNSQLLNFSAVKGSHMNKKH